MQSALHLRATVQSGGRVEIVSPELPSGANVDVIVLLLPALETPRRSALDILAEAPGQRLFKTAEEVDAYIREERDGWER